MYPIKTILLFTCIFLYVCLTASVQTLFFFLPLGLRYKIISRFSRLLSLALIRIVGIDLSVKGSVPRTNAKGHFVISNHLSYLDGIIMSSILPVIFISKLQVKSWPVFGLMSKISGTVFINRRAKMESLNSLKQISRILNSGANILLFPEGTSTNGDQVLPFQSIFFQTPLETGSSILAANIRYFKIGREDIGLFNRERVCWWGQVPFHTHLFSLLKLPRISVSVKIHAPLTPDDFPSGQGARKDLSETARSIITTEFTPINQG